MASKNIVLEGTTYNGVESITVPVSGGGSATFTEVSDTTASAADVANGKYFYDALGALTQGTASGGGGNYTFIASKDITANTTNTTAISVGTIYTSSETYDDNYIIYVRIRDKAGKRAGYFYGSDNWFINYNKANGYADNLTTAARLVHKCNSNGKWGQYNAGYGVYAYQIRNGGEVDIYTRYNSTNSLTINGTYSCEVYKLTFPDNVSPFDA